MVEPLRCISLGTVESRFARISTFIPVLVLACAIAAVPASSAFAAQGDCAQPASTGSAPTSTDCLFILQAAVFLRTCDPDPCICAPKGALPIAATDALVCLRRVTGQPVTLACPCMQPCEQSAAPACGGTCSEGTTCGEDVPSGGGCSCLNDCELSSAPACGGSCAIVGDSSLICQSLAFGVGENPPVDTCQCLPQGLQLCSSATAPECGGVCPAGNACEQQDGTCICAPLPIQGACAGASAPACAGTCPADSICQHTDGTCSCVAFSGQTETCADASAPACGGVCASGRLCAPNPSFACDCFSPCELGDAPVCNGDCFDANDVCLLRVVEFNGGTLEFCECLPAAQ